MEKIEKKTIETGLENNQFIGGALLARNTLFNLIGNVFPMLVAVVTIPIIINGIGTDRFGILTLAWMIVGYFSLFDLGLGRATTKFVSDYLAKGNHEKLVELVWASFIILFGFGILGAIIALLLTNWLVTDILNIPPELHNESIKAFYILALSVPILTGTAGSRGILEALQKFKLINYIKIPTYLTAFVTPLLILPFTNSLYPIIILLVVSRLLGLVAFMIACFKSVPNLSKFKKPSKELYKKLLGYGGWLTVSNIIWPILTYLDRFIIGALLTMTIVAYYTTPYELVTKLLIISGSMLGVMFPAFCNYAAGQPRKLIELHNKGIKYLLLALVPIVFLIITLAKPFFLLWLGQEFAKNSAFVLQVLALGILINSVSQVSSSAIQAMGRPDITAKLHLIELPLYLCGAYFMISNFGIKGAAIAWLARVIFDSVLLIYIVYRISPLKREEYIYPKTGLFIWSLAAIAISAPITLIDYLPLKYAALAIIFIVAIVIGWKYHLDMDERAAVKSAVGSVITRGGYGK